ncbi:MAG: hypothetical protein H7X95_04060 [Deltaproteobacteria bacterium]|nr:hypothetical protein [Deltaproteobacteria bacterium]
MDPRPLSDGGILDRVLLELGGSERADAPDGGNEAGEGDGGAVDGGGNDSSTGDGVSDVAPLVTTMSLTITDPAEDALQVATRRFAPTVMIEVTTDATRADDVKQVDAELWSTGAMPAKVSTTRLVQLNKTGQGDAGTGTGGSAGTSGGGAGVGGAMANGGSGVGTGGAVGSGGSGFMDAGPAVDASAGEPREMLFTFGDTPIDLSALTTGIYELRIAATTLAGITAAAVRKFRVDAGPVIRIIAPKVDQAARGSIFVSVQVTDPFSTTPPTVSISVANIPIAPLTIVGDLYQATVAETIAMPALSGQQLLDVGAVNGAGVAARHVTLRFVFDDVGPIIANGKPATGSLIGGIVKLEADITDPAGVDANTVVAVVAHGGNTLEVKLDQDPNDAKHFAHLFDTRRLSNTVLYPTISFRASDLPGNQSNIGYTVAVDNTPPLSELDPPPDLRIRKYLNQLWRCSLPFDPVGSDAVSEGDYVQQLFDIRARVEDQGNSPVAGNADITPLAGLDSTHVELLVLDDTNRALVVDRDGDGFCDAVNPKLVPTTTPMSSQDALLVNLAPVPPVGSADLTADANFPIGGYSDCTIGNDTLIPPAICKTTDLTIAVSSRYTTEAAVWTIAKVVPSTAQCVGNQFDSLGNHVNDGPACLAVHAIDGLGNAQVSRVLHVCIDHDGNRAECPFAALTSVQGGNPTQVTTAAPHGLVTGDRALVGSVPSLFEANGLWKVTVVSPTVFTLDTSNTMVLTVSGGQFMRWTATSDCTGRQTGINPVVVDDATPCRPWRRFNRGEHFQID